MSEYRALRERYSLLDICRTPDLADRSDAAAGTPHRGGRGDPLFRSAAAARADGHPLRLRPRRGAGHRDARCAPKPTSRACAGSSRAKRCRYVLEAIRQIKRELAGRVPLIGFAGAPFTLASYAIEGGHSNDFAHTKALMYGAPGGVASLLRPARRRRRRLSDRADRSRRRRGAGVRLVGRRAERARLPRVHPAAHAANLRSRSRPLGVPTIHFGVGTGSILARAARGGRRRDRRRLAHAARRGVDAHRVRSRHPGQSRSHAAARRRSTGCRRGRRRAASAPGGRPGHIFNLGHGICRPRRSSTCRRSRDTSIRRRDNDNNGGQ